MATHKVHPTVIEKQWMASPVKKKKKTLLWQRLYFGAAAGSFSDRPHLIPTGPDPAKDVFNYRLPAVLQPPAQLDCFFV